MKKYRLHQRKNDIDVCINIVFHRWVESTILIQSENTFAQLRTLIPTLF